MERRRGTRASWSVWLGCVAALAGGCEDDVGMGGMSGAGTTGVATISVTGNAASTTGVGTTTTGEPATTGPTGGTANAGTTGTANAGTTGAIDAGATDATDAGTTGGGTDGAVADPVEAGVDGGANDDPSAPVVVAGCDDAMLYEVNPDEPSELGPWPVGVKTVSVPVSTGGSITAELWYPATRGSEAGLEKVAYDLRDWLPEGAVEIPEAQNKLAECDCYRDLPLDTEHGPYPTVVFIHGLGSFRVSSRTATALWASRGFVVVAADHPGDMLTDFLAGIGFLSGCSGSGDAGGDMASEGLDVIAALRARSGDFAFLDPVLDTRHMGLVGHSQGGEAVSSLGGTEGVDVIITLAPLGGGTITNSGSLSSTLQVTGTADSVTGYSTDWFGASQSMVKRHVGVTGAGHIDVTDLCKETNADGKTAIQVASDEGVCGASVLALLAQCGDDAAAKDAAPDVVNYATTAALEETLHCQDRTAAFAALQNRFPEVGEYLTSP